MVDLSFGSIVNGYITLLSDTSYTLMNNLVVDGSTFVGVSGGDATTYLNGQGYTITVSGSYDASASFPNPVNLSNLTLINPISTGSWGNANPDATCYAFVGPLAGPTVVGIADISSDYYIHLWAGTQYTLSEDLAVSAGEFNGFRINGTGNVILDGAGRTVTMTSNGGLMSNDAQGASLLVKHLVVDASGVALANGNGWIFGSSFASSNMIAMNCSVTCGNLDLNSGGIFGGGNIGFVCATGCSVVCGNIMGSNSLGGGGGMCGGANGIFRNTATISITDCTATITGSVTNGSSGGGGGGGGMCGGANGLIGGTPTITITGCTATITGSVTNGANAGGAGGMCGGYNGVGGSAHITITDCFAEISGVIQFGSILGADMINIILTPYSPYDLSLNGTILGWVGGDDVSYNIYVGTAVRDLSGITGLSADISSQLQYGIQFRVKSIYNGRESAFSDTIIYLATPAAIVPCFLANAPVLTPTGYTKISKLAEGDKVMTGDGRVVAIQRISHTRVAAGPSVNPYVIPKGLFGATARLLISPDHRVSTENGLLEARLLGLKQEEMAGEIDYYNLELPSWSQDTMVVAGVVVESLAPVRRITMTLGAFKKTLVAQYGALTPAVLAKVQKTCRLLADGRVECPVLPKK